MTALFRVTLLAALFLAANATVAISQASAQSVALMVNGEPITNFDIEQRGKLDALSTHQIPPREQIINELIDEKVKIREAKKYSIDPSDSDMDSMYAGLATRMHMNPEQLTKTLETAGVRAETLKKKIKADQVWVSLVRGRFKESLLVSEQEVQTASGEKSDDTTAPKAFEYSMRPVVLVVDRNGGQAALESRRKEAEALRARVQTCDEASSLFRSMRDAAIRDTVVKTSADLAGPLRELLDNTPIGHLTPPETTKQGIEMVVLCDRKPTAADTPAKRELRDKMFMQKYEAKSNAYLQEIRRAAMIENRQ
jgi:peptidyl-prolyl cis-trans isomerase SurA